MHELTHGTKHYLYICAFSCFCLLWWCLLIWWKVGFGLWWLKYMTEFANHWGTKQFPLCVYISKYINTHRHDLGISALTNVKRENHKGYVHLSLCIHNLRVAKTMKTTSILLSSRPPWSHSLIHALLMDSHDIDTWNET